MTTLQVLAIAGFIVGWLIAGMVSDYRWGKLYYELNKAQYISNSQAPTTAELNASVAAACWARMPSDGPLQLCCDQPAGHSGDHKAGALHRWPDTPGRAAD